MILKRTFGDSKETLGILSHENFSCCTLELGWHDNQDDISCIPTGTYLCKWTRSKRLSTAAGHDVFTYEVTGVPGRSGIRIHSANFFYQLLGCIALGDGLTDMNSDGEKDVIHSRTTIEKFNELMNKQDFYLTIE